MKSVSFLRSALAALAVCSAAVFSMPSEARADTNLILCNKTGAKIFIALVHQDVQTGRWILSAWQNREPGACQSYGMVKSGLFYYYAEKEGRTSFWPSRDSVEKTYCVPQTRVRREMANSGCAPGERSLGFRGRVMDPGTYTFSFS